MDRLSSGRRPVDKSSCTKLLPACDGAFPSTYTAHKGITAATLPGKALQDLHPHAAAHWQRRIYLSSLLLPLPKPKQPQINMSMGAGVADAADLEATGADAAEAQGEGEAAEGLPDPSAEEEDDFEAAEADEEEDEVQHLGGEGFSPAELAAAQVALGIQAQVCCLAPSCCAAVML